MVDENYWKEKYKDYWTTAADKEEKVRKIIEKECNCTIEYSGLGAGSAEYLPGSAASRGYKKGGSDLKVKNTNLFIEVTGPNVESVRKDDDLWIRPDKIQNAIRNPENDYWIVHVLKSNFYIRIIHINDEFKNDFRRGAFRLITPRIRDAEEKYIAVPASSKHITNIESLCKAIKKALK